VCHKNSFYNRFLLSVMIDEELSQSPRLQKIWENEYIQRVNKICKVIEELREGL